jgi:hypothetical protein
VQKRTGRAKRRDNAIGAAIVGDVAARAAGHEYFHARLTVFFQQQRPPAALRGAGGREQPSRASPNNDYLRWLGKFQRRPYVVASDVE